MALSHQTTEPNFFKSSSKTHASPPVPLVIGDDDPDHLPIVQEKSLSNLIIFLKFHTLRKFVISIKHFSRSKRAVRNHTHNFSIVFMGKCLDEHDRSRNYLRHNYGAMTLGVGNEVYKFWL